MDPVWVTIGLWVVTQAIAVVVLVTRHNSAIATLKESLQEMRDDIREINTKRGEQWAKICTIEADVAVLKERCRLSRCID